VLTNSIVDENLEHLLAKKYDLKHLEKCNLKLRTEFTLLREDIETQHKLKKQNEKKVEAQYRA